MLEWLKYGLFFGAGFVLGCYAMGVVFSRRLRKLTDRLQRLQMVVKGINSSREWVEKVDG